MRHSALRPRSIGWCDDGADDAGRATVLSCSGQEPSRRGAHASAKVSRSLSARPVPARAARYPRSETFMTRKDVTRVSWRARTKPWSSPALTAGVSPADGAALSCGARSQSVRRLRDCLRPSGFDPEGCSRSASRSTASSSGNGRQRSAGNAAHARLRIVLGDPSQGL